MTSIVDRLEAAGLVARRRHPEDGRAVLAEITEAGRQLVERATADLVASRFALTSLEPDQLAARGREAESRALARAVRWHAETRVIVVDNRTVVFS